MWTIRDWIDWVLASAFGGIAIGTFFIDVHVAGGVALLLSFTFIREIDMREIKRKLDHITKLMEE